MQIVTGSDRDNTTVLAAVSASGAVLPPLILYSRVSRFKRHGGRLLLQIISFIHGFMLTKKVG